MAMVFPDKLVREARQEAGLTQAELGQRLGMTQSAVAKLERPGANPTVETLDRVLRAAHTRLHICEAPWLPGVDDTLIEESLKRSPAERIRTAAEMHAFGRTLANAPRIHGEQP